LYLFGDKLIFLNYFITFQLSLYLK